MKRFITFLCLLVILGIGVISGEPIKLLSYNIKGHGMTSSRLEHIATVIKTQSPDVVALQEVDNRTFIGTKHDYLSDLAEATGMHPSFFALVGSYYGIGLLSKTEPILVQTQSFEPSDTSKDKEARGFIIAEFDDFYFLCTHYSLNADDRDTATAWAIDFAHQSDKTVFIAGDFNAQPTYRAMVTFKKNGFTILNNTSAYTYPAKAPTSCIDMIISYCGENSQEYDVVQTDVITSVPGLTLSDVSDHLPVYATVEVVKSGIENCICPTEIKMINTEKGVSFLNLREPSQINIYDWTGRLLGFCWTDNGVEIPFPSYESGIYFLNIKNSYQGSTFKYILNH